MVDSEGNLVSQVEADKALKQVWEVLETASEYSTSHGEKLQPSASLYDFYEDWCKWAIERNEVTEREAELLLGMSKMWGAYVGDRIELQSLKFFYLEDCIEGGKHKESLPRTGG